MAHQDQIKSTGQSESIVHTKMKVAGKPNQTEIELGANKMRKHKSNIEITLLLLCKLIANNKAIFRLVLGLLMCHYSVDLICMQTDHHHS